MPGGAPRGVQQSRDPCHGITKKNENRTFISSSLRSKGASSRGRHCLRNSEEYWLFSFISSTICLQFTNVGTPTPNSACGRRRKHGCTKYLDSTGGPGAAAGVGWPDCRAGGGHRLPDLAGKEGAAGVISGGTEAGQCPRHRHGRCRGVRGAAS